MQSFTVHLADPSRRDAAALEKAAFVPDGFAPWATAFGGFWLVWNRLWVALGLYLVALAAMLGLVAWFRLDPLVGMGLSSLFHLFLGFEGNNIRRMALERSGQPAVDVVTARKREEAEAKFFAAAVEQRPALPVPVAGSVPARPAQPAILGVFPEPGGRS